MENSSKIIRDNCLFCGENGQRILGDNPDFLESKIYYCKFCKSIYSYPVPSEDDLEVVYKRHYREVRKEKPDQRYLSSMRQRAKSQKETISTFLKAENTFLDIGSGAGVLLAEFQRDFKYLDAYEPDILMYEESTKLSNNKTLIYNSACKVENLKDNNYDLITLSHVFEHLPNPVGYLKNLLSKLTASGIIFIEVPNESVSIVKEQILYKVTGLMHINYFNRISFLKVFGEFCDVLHIQEYSVSNRLFRVVTPNKRDVLRYLYFQIYKFAPGFFSKIGMVNILDRTLIAKSFGKKNSAGIYLRIILKRKQ